MSNLMKLKELAKVQTAAALTERIQRSEKARHRRFTAHARARYRCFLPDLAGLARIRRVRPMPDLVHSSKLAAANFPRNAILRDAVCSPFFAHIQFEKYK